MRSERGAVSVIVAISATMLIGLAAIAVDLSAGWNERARDQTGADLAALSAVTLYSSGSDPQTVVDSVIASLDTNVRAIPAADWSPGSCSDPDHLPLTALALGLTPATECISFSRDLKEVRVRTTDQSVETSFGTVLGIDELTTSASATARAGTKGGSPPPFAVLTGFEAGDSACLRTSSNITPGPTWQGNGPGVAPSAVAASTDPCDSGALDLSSQYFGTLDPPIWLDDAGNLICKSNEIAYLIAGGIDHGLSRFIDTPVPQTSPGFGQGPYGVPDSRAVEDTCGATSKPNTIPLTTGLSNSVLRCGLITARSGGCATAVPGPAGRADRPARLQRGDFVQGTHRFVGEEMDNMPLWDLLRSDIATVSAPAECATVYANRTNPAWDYYDKRDEMIECLRRWKDASYDTIFSDDIIRGARFSFVPLLAETNLDTAMAGGPSPCITAASPKCVHINDWVPIYVETLYVESNGLGPDCDPNGVDVGRHHAGQQFSCGANNKNVDAVSALVLGCGMLPTDLCASRPANPHDPGGDPVPEVRLTR